MATKPFKPPKLRIPHAGTASDDEGEIRYSPETLYQSIVYKYSGIPIDRQKELRVHEYLQLRRDAYINTMNKTESGREYLEECYIAEQTQPDRGALRKDFDVKEV